MAEDRPCRIAPQTEMESGVATHNTSVTLDWAYVIIEAARAEADDIGVPMNIAVCVAGRGKKEE